MDAIFQCSMSFMDEPLMRFESYMERASLQLKVELEEYVESTLNTSSSIFMTEGTETFFEKFKKAIKLIIDRLKEFIQDTKMNIEKYRKERAAEKRLEKLADILNKSDKLKSLQVKYKDYSPKAKFIKREKEALKRMIRKKDTTADEIKFFMERYKNELSDIQKLCIAVTTVLAIKIISKAFFQGIYDGFNRTYKDANDIISEFENVSHVAVESVETKDDIYDETDVMIAYTKALAEITTDDIKTQREMVEEFEASLCEIERAVNHFIDDEEE